MLELITGRRSAAALAAPGPDDRQLAAILAAAASVPDHGRLRPYRFVVVRGEARHRFGEALSAAAVEAAADDITIAKARRKPFFGPLLVAIIASPEANASVPEWEQVASATLTGYAMELAAAALGLGAVWKSGRHLDGEPIRRLLAMRAGEQLMGWINLGTAPRRDGKPMRSAEETERPLPRVTELAPDPLIDVGTLAGRVAAPDMVICDTRWYLGAPERGRAEYLTAHIPGALFVDLDADLADHTAPGQLGRHPLPEPVAFARRMGELGIGPDTTVVAYDDGSGAPASRLWWMLDALGHRGVRVLDGGIAAWRAAGETLESGAGLLPTPVTLTLAPVWPRTIERDDLRARIDDLTLLDVRAGERYRGEVEPVDPLPGHIPGAVSAPDAANVGPDGMLRAPGELLARFESLGATSGEVVVSCGSGVTACHTALAMRVAGLPDPVLYAGSYSDWVNAGLPVATGSEPGTPDRSKNRFREALTPRPASNCPSRDQRVSISQDAWRRVASARLRRQAQAPESPLQIAPLGRIEAALDRGAIGLGRRSAVARPSQQVRPNGVVQVVFPHARIGGPVRDPRERRFRAIDHGHSDGAVERHDRRWRELLEASIQGHDGGPVGGRRVRSQVVLERDRCLYLVRPGGAHPNGVTQYPLAFRDGIPVPA